jgi:cell division protein FtsB
VNKQSDFFRSRTPKGEARKTTAVLTSSRLKGDNAMKLRLAWLLLAATLLTGGASALAQDTNDTAQNLETLRAQLNEVQNKEAELKNRIQQLDFDLKPENIERYFNGYGSVHPEELREHRRKQLQAEKDRVLAQLDQLASSRTHLENAIASAQARAYQQSAIGKAALKPDPNRGDRFLTAGRILIGISALFLVGGGILAVVMRRKSSRAQ